MLAHDIAARIRYAGHPLDAAVSGAIRDGPEARVGRGGVIALDRHGTAVLRFNSEGMYRGLIRADGRPETAIHSAS